MGKRVADENTNDENPKRVKTQHGTATLPASNHVQIESSKQLSAVLEFHQSNIAELRNGLRAAKRFLEQILYAEDKHSTARQESILKDFLDAHTPKNHDEASLPSLFQAWDFAAQTSNDSLVSATSAIIALFLKTLSNLVNLRDYGIQLCRTVLQSAHLKLIARSLAAPKQKEHIISPCLRLLTEVISFDGGSMSKQVFAARLFTLDTKVIARSLGIIKTASGEQGPRPTVRSNAVHYLLASLKLHSASAKIEILRMTYVFKVLFEHLRTDPANLVIQILSSFRDHVISDQKVPRQVIGLVLGDRNLSNIAAIFRRGAAASDTSEDDDEVTKAVDQFLRDTCTSQGAGVVRPSQGWYPYGVDPNEESTEQTDLNPLARGLESVEWFHGTTENLQVRNVVLSKLLQNLQPHSSEVERNLCIGILQAAPELVADYFSKKNSFLFDPKLTATWMGLAAFVYSSIQLPTPFAFGLKSGYSKVPPPISVVMENILPRPLTQKALIRCLNQQHDLIILFASRILILAFRKLQEVLRMFKEASQRQGPAWDEAADMLVHAFAQKCPSMKEIIATARKMDQTNHVLTESICRLLHLYYEVMPLIALDEKFDVSVMLTDTLSKLEESTDAATVSSDEAGRENQLMQIEINHLLQVAKWNPDTKWFNKPERLRHSLFSSLVRMSVHAKNAPKQTLELLDRILLENNVVQKRSSSYSADVPVASLMATKDPHVLDSVTDTLNDVCSRLVRKPIKYEDDLDELMEITSSQNRCISLIWLVIVEQWPFIAQRAEAPNVAGWISQYATACVVAGENQTLLKKLISEMSEFSRQDSFGDCFTTALETDVRSRLSSLTASETFKESPMSTSVRPLPDSSIDFSTFSPPDEEVYHRSLHTLLPVPAHEALLSLSLHNIIHNLSSVHPEIRSLALRNIHTYMTSLLTPPASQNVPDAKQIYLLLGILVTTATPVIQEEPLPHLVTTYSAIAIQILQSPLHPLYDKVARYHTKAPRFEPSRLASHWISRILRAPPSSYAAPSIAVPATSSTTTNTETHLAAADRPFGANDRLNELHFLLAWLYTGLRGAADLELLRAGGVFEPVMALALTGTVPDSLRALVLRILWRATGIEGGSAMLMKRRGVIAWIEAFMATREDNRVKIGAKGGEDARLLSRSGLKDLVRRLWATCDQAELQEWSGGLMERSVNAILDSTK